MKCLFYIFTLILSCFVLGCSGLVSNLTSPQTWSTNYATLEGATCTYVLKNSQIPVPEMIDGDLETVGKSSHRIIVMLPDRRSIHRIVLRGTNIEDVIVYQGLSGLGGEDWRKIKQVKNNRKPTLDLRVSTVTDRIRFQVGGTFDDQPLPGAPQFGVMTGRRVKRGVTIVQEIELYGFADKGSQIVEKPEEVEDEVESLMGEMEAEPSTEEMETGAPMEGTEEIEEETPEF